MNLLIDLKVVSKNVAKQILNFLFLGFENNKQKTKDNILCVCIYIYIYIYIMRYNVLNIL